MNPAVQTILRCPACGARIQLLKNHLQCLDCLLKYPIEEDIPALLNERPASQGDAQPVKREK